MPLQAAWALCLGGGPDLPGFGPSWIFRCVHIIEVGLEETWKNHLRNSWDHNLFDGLRASNLSSHMGDMPNIAQPVAP